MKDDKILLYHILECLDEIHSFLKEDKDIFIHERMAQLATLRSLQTMSESLTKLSNELKIENAHIPWKNINGFRNILVHDYLGLDYETVWIVIEKELPIIRKFVESTLEKK